jgi:hypothetical protein
LFDTANGHSFEVDTWSIGVILYTFIVGRPLVLCDLNSPFPGASAIINTSFRLTGMSRSMRASLCSRSSHPTLRSALRCLRTGRSPQFPSHLASRLTS